MGLPRSYELVRPSAFASVLSPRGFRTACASPAIKALVFSRPPLRRCRRLPSIRHLTDLSQKVELLVLTTLKDLTTRLRSGSLSFVSRMLPAQGVRLLKADPRGPAPIFHAALAASCTFAASAAHLSTAFLAVELGEVELSPCLGPLAQTARAVFPQAAFLCGRHCGVEDGLMPGTR